MFLLANAMAIHSEIIESPSFNDNALVEPEDSGSSNSINNHNEGNLLDVLSEKPEQAELEFRYPISAIGVDYGKNSVILRFQKHARKQRFKYDPELDEKRRSLQDNFMHFGKRQAEQLPLTSDASYYDRYGRDPKQDFMRFGRAPSDFMRFGRAPSDFMRFGRSDNYMRFGRNLHMEELRSPKQDFMRFGRPDNFMRFGRSATPSNFERNGKMDPNFMRFGKSLQSNQESNHTHKISIINGKQQNKMEENPTDKAIALLFHKSKSQVEPQPKSSELTESQNNLEDSVEQFFEQ
ncbi:Fmrf [Drosophila busckii]|uniref:Fmrf n=2 Tax=Drosophila busckii TaxID=30019 RepID=A0A0M3QUF8_DROBS|nr:Fmrf [Drosophila busckii]